MSRTELSANRRKNIINANLGQIILFCEGMTEKRYFEYFTDIIENDKSNKFNDVIVEIESADGNASRVFKFANNFLDDKNNNRKYVNYKKYLVFDCDAPPNAQDIINNMLKSDKKYELLISNCFFEIWLLMHFENVNEKISKGDIYRKLSDHLYHTYKKGDNGTIREIIQNGSIEEAIRNAEELSDKYLEAGKDICGCIGEMDPYTNVYIIVEELLKAIS